MAGAGDSGAGSRDLLCALTDSDVIAADEIGDDESDECRVEVRTLEGRTGALTAARALSAAGTAGR